MALNSKTLDQLVDDFYTRPGVVIGDKLTCTNGLESEIAEFIVAEISEYAEVQSDQTIGQLLDSAKVLSEAELVRLRDGVKDRYRNGTSPFHLEPITKVNWSACISITKDLRFESELRNYLDSQPNSRSATVVSNEDTIVPSGSIPIYKLYGNILETEDRSALALSKSEILIRQAIWPKMIRAISDYLKGGELIFLGTDNSHEDVQWILTSLLTLSPLGPKKLIFLRSDSTYKNDTVSSLLRNFDVTICDANVSEIATAISEIKPKQSAFDFPIAIYSDSTKLNTKLAKYSHVISLVPTECPKIDFTQHRNSLLDSLFRPTSVEWTPYLLNLALGRDITDELESKIDEIFKGHENSKRHECIIVRGEASVGKTTVLKQLSVKVAAKGTVVIWIRRRAAGSTLRIFREMSRELMEHAKSNAEQLTKLMIVCDNAIGLNVNPNELMDCFDSLSLPICFVFSIRMSEYFSSADNQPSLFSNPESDFEIPYELTADEISRLPSMLVDIGAAENTYNAQKQIDSANTSVSSDILCSLWYLLPETQSSIANSLQDEYVRLGNIQQMVESAAANAADSSDIAKRAYEAVTVLSNMNIGLPIEVLVRYLNVDYQDWVEIVGHGRPLWGLLYEEYDETGTTISYRTRNEVVTKVLLELVNGGAVGHSGEGRIISELVRACSIGTSVYREFVMSVLITHKDKIQNIFTYDKGLQLFDLARSVLPFEDRVLEHHKGLWMQNDRENLHKAYHQLERAMECNEYPGSNRSAPISHIQNSLAATVIMMIEEGKQEISSGVELVQEHLLIASREGMFNLYSLHISANLYFTLATTRPENMDSQLSIICISNALEIVENACQKIGRFDGMKSIIRYRKDIELLSELREKIIEESVPLEELKKVAESIFERDGSSAGFILAARKQLSIANRERKGKAYNGVKDYLDACIDRVGVVNSSATLELRAVRVDLVVRWRLQTPTGAIDWEQFRDDTDAVRKSAKYNDDIVKQFYHAVALYNMSDFSTANAIFSQLRRLRSKGMDMRLVRAWYVGPEGYPRRCQCRIVRSQSRYYAEFTEMGIDIPLVHLPSDGAVGTTVQVYIGLSLNGAQVAFDKHADRSILLA